MSEPTENVKPAIESLGRGAYNAISKMLDDPKDVSTALNIALALNAARNTLPTADKKEVAEEIIAEFLLLLDQLWVIEAKNREDGRR